MVFKQLKVTEQWQLSECFCSFCPLWEADCRFCYNGTGSHRIHAALETKIQVASPSLLARCLNFQFATGVRLSLAKMCESGFLSFFCDGNCLSNLPLCGTHFDGLGNSGGGETVNSLPLAQRILVCFPAHHVIITVIPAPGASDILFCMCIWVHIDL